MEHLKTPQSILKLGLELKLPKLPKTNLRGQIRIQAPFHFLGFLWNEVKLNARYLGYDIGMFMPFCIITTFYAWSTSASKPTLKSELTSFDLFFSEELTLTFARCLFYAWLFVSILTITDQYTGFEQDKISKPWRPIPSGRTTREATLFRCIAIILTYLLFSHYFGILPLSIFYIFIVFCYNFAQWDHTLAGKTLYPLFLAIPYVFNLWMLVTPRVDANCWLLFLRAEFHMLILAMLQDLRDVKGDKVTGRKTMPIVFGAEVVKKAGAVLMLFDLAIYVALFTTAITMPTTSQAGVGFGLNLKWNDFGSWTSFSYGCAVILVCVVICLQTIVMSRLLAKPKSKAKANKRMNFEREFWTYGITLLAMGFSHFHVLFFKLVV